MSTSTLTIALIGNPNTGKSTLFNALAGLRQRVGNYPGVTVEKKIGHVSYAGQRFALVDLPGTYSLAPRSPDEMISVDVLLGRQAEVPKLDGIICIVDASNLERNLYLVSQVLEIGLPIILALNMVDVARSRGITIDVKLLEARLGVPVVELEAHRRIGIESLRQSLARISQQKPASTPSPFSETFCGEIAGLERRLANSSMPWPRFLVERLLLDTSGYLDDAVLDGKGGVRDAIAAARGRLAAAGEAVPGIEAVSRYRWISQVLEGVVTRPVARKMTASDRLDRVLTHKLWGTLIFALLMIVIFQSVFLWAVPLMNGVDWVMGTIGDAVGNLMDEGPLRSLLVDGVIAGFGSVVIFLPQIFILFFFIAVLEDCGYMARAAYLMDRLMVRVGLSGKSFIPMLSSFACAIPGIMAARVIENRRDRLTTILVAPLMSCSARLPVYTMLIVAFIPARSFAGGWLRLQGLVMFAMYTVGIVAAVAVALVLKRTLLRGATPPFVMELPSYKWPSLRLVVYRMLDRGWAFVRRAGTLIVAVSIVIWAALYYPHDSELVEKPFASRVEQLNARLAAIPEDQRESSEAQQELGEVQNEIAGAYQRQSFLGRAGHAIEPLVRPLGWDWRIGCAVIASFPAREVVVATLGVIYNLGSELDVESDADRTRLQEALSQATWDGTDRKVYNIPVALSLMVFFALCAQCASTLVTIRRETNSWAWPAFTFVYMTTLAYVAALVTYRVGMLFVA